MLRLKSSLLPCQRCWLAITRRIHVVIPPSCFSRNGSLSSQPSMPVPGGKVTLNSTSELHRKVHGIVFRPCVAASGTGARPIAMVSFNTTQMKPTGTVAPGTFGNKIPQVISTASFSTTASSSTTEQRRRRRRRGSSMAMGDDNNNNNNNIDNDGDDGSPTSCILHKPVQDPDHFIREARKVISKIEAALLPLKQFNDPFILKTGRDNDTGNDYLELGLGPMIGTYTLEVSEEQRTIVLFSPMSGQMTYILSASTGEWCCQQDGHNMEGLLVRDLIRQIKGVPKL